MELVMGLDKLITSDLYLISRTTILKLNFIYNALTVEYSYQGLQKYGTRACDGLAQLHNDLDNLSKPVTSRS